jgi:hypothetical protein
MKASAPATLAIDAGLDIGFQSTDMRANSAYLRAPSILQWLSTDRSKSKEALHGDEVAGELQPSPFSGHSPGIAFA